MKTLFIATLLIISVLTASAQNCKGIKRSVDDFTGKVTITNSLVAYRYTPFMIKDIEGGETSYAINFSAGGLTYTRGKGIDILFTDNSQLNFPDIEVKINVDRTTGYYKYSAWLYLDEEELNVFKTKQISKYRVYIHDTILSKSHGIKFINDVNCIIDLL